MMIGIRWILGIPFGICVYQFLIWLNIKFLIFVVSLIPSMPELILQIETLIVDGVIVIYISVASIYFALPRDRYAILNNIKVKVLYWILCIWSVIQIILFGASIYDAFHGYLSHVVWQMLYAVVGVCVAWMTYQGIAMVDFKHNQPYRDYLMDEYEKEQQIAITE